MWVSGQGHLGFPGAEVSAADGHYVILLMKPKAVWIGGQIGLMFLHWAFHRY